MKLIAIILLICFSSCTGGRFLTERKERATLVCFIQHGNGRASLTLQTVTDKCVLWNVAGRGYRRNKNDFKEGAQFYVHFNNRDRVIKIERYEQ